MGSKSNVKTFNPWVKVMNWLPLILPILWYVIFQLDIVYKVSQTHIAILYHDFIAKIIPSIDQLKTAENFNYLDALMYSTFWWFFPLLSKLSYSNIMLTVKHKQSLFLKKSKLSQHLTLAGLLIIVLFTVIFPFPIMHKGTDTLYFNSSYLEIFGLLGLSGGFTCLGLFIAYLKITHNNLHNQ